MIRRLASLHWLQLGEVRQLHRYYQDAMTPCCRPAALRFLRLAVPRFHSLRFAPSPDECTDRDLELLTRYLRSGNSPRSEQGSPKFLGTLGYPFAMFQSDSGRTACVRPLTTQKRGPWYAKSRGLPRLDLRSSIAWLSDSLFTLRSADYSNTTQNSLPVAGQALPDGISTRKVPLKGFRVAGYTSSSFPKLCLAQLHQPRWLRVAAKSQRSTLRRDTSVVAPFRLAAEACPPAVS